MSLETLLPTWQRLSTKIVGVLLGFLCLALLAIGTTLMLSWQLEGSSAAINETGSLRMRNYRLTVLLGRAMAEPVPHAARVAVLEELKTINDTFLSLQRGDPQRPLALPPTSRIQERFRSVNGRWNRSIQSLANDVLNGSGPKKEAAWKSFQSEVESFVHEVDALVKAIERDSEMRTFWLRASQMALVALALSGTVAIIYLMFLLIVEPVERLRVGMQRMTEKDFGARLPVESNDEFGQLTRGFNRMADRLEELYNSLEERVKAKTAALEDQNRELALLYDSAEFLQRQQTVEAMCGGFLQRIRLYFGADGGSVRVVDDRNGNMHMVVHNGISAELVKAEQCMKVGQCLCGEAVEKRVAIVHDLRLPHSGQELQCRREGFATVSVFQIFAYEEQIGFINLHFRQARSFSEREQALLETLGQMLGTAIENVRLASREREMAISEERNLVAQGLHDSIAQGLTFMNIQLQMLDESLRGGRLDEVAEIVPALRSGVQESYEDVRELLLNFRSRLAEDDLVGSLSAAVEKFRRQTGLAVEFVAEGSGPPFSREQQLQVLFIVQEAMSNIRKHAMAGHVEIRLHDSADFLLTICDDGVGFEAETLLKKGDGHVGINIMRERAQRIQASLDVVSAAGRGTTVSLHLPQEQRRAA
ncbi:MAG TPA: type IV pili methyl-accepting chemotaxis transducer N-terminal domain-containing protein [Noviherbaspirillum sp.]|uniref:type IV pili methyl-accepting chemotaxis transducer N-terminal domain-containing protein n=1 Tax=Noviherbaspirillum sp. TaxID=1926288 RepID=UPI002D41293E|nr:type IV pili methyl-accepting chemotaxis transducer N-terminal domain-containing protein [Noviherbaspirillum sp.]HYD95810.1 type IV pili methyl-accepting chemotaxis transducer N-terminal domain-containing protein [Noviherbaspirillum sp.]